MSRTILFFAGAAALGGHLSAAQNVGAPKTLGEALIQAKGKSGAFVCLDHDKPLPSDWRGDPRNFESLLDRMGLKLTKLGGLEAVVSKNRRELRPPNAMAHPFDGLKPDQALAFLVSSFSAGQWSRLQSSRGIGLGDLASDTQRGLFLFLVGGEKLHVGETAMRKWLPDLEGSPSRRRLRLTQMARVYLPVKLDGREATIGAKVPGKYFAVLDPSESASPSFADVPNVLRLPDSIASLPGLQNALSPDEAARLDSSSKVVQAIRRASGLEIYLDPRYGDRKVLLNSPSQMAASDLLKGLLVSLDATLRKVGPAYVVTNAQAGWGTRHEQWRRFEVGREADLARLTSGVDPVVGEAFRQAQNLVDDSSHALTAEQSRRAVSGQGALRRLATTYGELTADQQEEVRQARESDSTTKDVELNSTSRVELVVKPVLQILDSGLDGPATLSGAAEFLEKYLRRSAKGERPNDRSKTPSLDGELKKFESRTAIFDYHVLPGSAEPYELLKTAGFTSLWVGVPTDDLLAADGAANAGRSIRDRLKTIVSSAAAAGLKPRLIFDPLLRRPGLSNAAYDRTILGETGGPSWPLRSDGSVRWIDPATFDAPSAARIARLVESLDGLEGIVLGSTAVPGYTVPSDGSFQFENQAFGYSEPQRLRFLRQTGIDPIDLPTQNSVQLNVDLNLLTFGPSHAEVTANAVRGWAQARSKLNESVVQGLATAFLKSNLKPREGAKVLVEQRRSPLGGFWYGSWEGDGKLLPGSYKPGEQSSSAVNFSAEWAKTQSGLVVLAYPLPPDATPDAIARRLGGLAELYPGGIAIDLRGWGGESVPFEKALRTLR